MNCINRTHRTATSSIRQYYWFDFRYPCNRSYVTYKTWITSHSIKRILNSFNSCYQYEMIMRNTRCNSIYNRKLSSTSFSTNIRRPRNRVGYSKVEGNMPSFKKTNNTNIDTAGLVVPYEHYDSNSNLENYLQKASLSPWTPIPDVVARKMFDMVITYKQYTNHNNHKNDDVLLNDMIHIDLGCGDGRVNFHAIDYYKVKHSIGVDIDENITQIAIDRLNKRHPKPTNIEFLIGDLLIPPSTIATSTINNNSTNDSNDDSININNNHNIIWNKIKDATLITMYFATDGLKLIRPLLEKYIISSNQKNLIIITCGYEMPGWKSNINEVVLGTQIHLYSFGNNNDDNDENDENDDNDDTLLLHPPRDLLNTKTSNEKLNGANVVDRTGKYPIRGYNPNYNDDEEESDDDDDDDDDADDNKNNNNYKGEKK